MSQKQVIFLEQLLVIRSRYKLLMLVGSACTGNTVWAKWIFGDEQNVLEVNCASCPEPDLGEFRPLEHRGILFDEASCLMVLQQNNCSKHRPRQCAWVAPLRTATPTTSSSAAE